MISLDFNDPVFYRSARSALPFELFGQLLDLRLAGDLGTQYLSWHNYVLCPRNSPWEKQDLSDFPMTNVKFMQTARDRPL